MIFVLVFITQNNYFLVFTWLLTLWFTFYFQPLTAIIHTLKKTNHNSFMLHLHKCYLSLEHLTSDNTITIDIIQKVYVYSWSWSLTDALHGILYIIADHIEVALLKTKSSWSNLKMSWVQISEEFWVIFVSSANII